MPVPVFRNQAVAEAMTRNIFCYRANLAIAVPYRGINYSTERFLPVIAALEAKRALAASSETRHLPQQQSPCHSAGPFVRRSRRAGQSPWSPGLRLLPTDAVVKSHSIVRPTFDAAHNL